MKNANRSKTRLIFTLFVVLFCYSPWYVNAASLSYDSKAIKKSRPAKTKVPAKTFKSANAMRSNKTSRRKFEEVEITLNEKLNLSDISNLPRAPGSKLEVMKNSRRVRAQLPASEVKTLAKTGANIKKLRKFVLVRGSKGKGIANNSDVDMTADQGILSSYCQGSNSTNYSIPEGEWTYSEICISCAPGGATVTSIDVHYEIIHPYVGDLIVDLTDADLGCEYHLWENEGGSANNINETVTGITMCNGEVVNQCWLLWAADVYVGDFGYIDYWWIKVYYEDISGPSHDDCADAIAVAAGAAYYDSTVGATGSYESACSYNDTADVWHSYMATSTGVVTISLAGSSFDTTLSVFDHCGGTELACNDDASGTLQSELILSVTAGTTYLIRVAGYDGVTGDYILYIEGCSSPANDDCADAIAVAESVPYNGTTDCATGDYVSDCSYNDTADVWHSYTPDSGGPVTISLAGSSFDTTLGVFDYCGGTELACNDDTCDSLQSEIAMNITEAHTYLIRVAGYNGAVGDYTLTVTHNPCNLPPEPSSPIPANGANNVPVDTTLSWNGYELFGGANSPATKSAPKIGVPKVIYGNDDRLDEYEVKDADILAIGDSTVALISLVDDLLNPCDVYLINNGDGTFSFSLPDSTYAEWYECEDPIYTGNPLCLDEPFYNQPNPAFCSGFLVAPDIIATSGHCACDCASMAVVFTFVMLDPNTPRLTIDESEIYYCSEVIERTDGSDWALIRLDREVSGHTPLQTRIVGTVDIDEPLLVIGHPVGLPRKYAGGASVRGNNPLSPQFEANIDTYMGNSGSPVFNADTLKVEGILSSGNPDWVQDGSCDRSNVCPDDPGCPGWEYVTRTTEFAGLMGWAAYDVYFDTVCPPTQLVCNDSDTSICDLCCDLDYDTTYYWKVVAKNPCGDITADPCCWSFTTLTGDISAELDLDPNSWMYQNLPGQTASNLTATVSITDDPLGNSSYTYAWEIILPDDVTTLPSTVSGGGAGDTSWTFAAPGCDDPCGISDSGQVFTVEITVTGVNHGNTGTAQAQFGIALLGDVNNNGVVDGGNGVVDPNDRFIVNTFWRNGSAGSFTFRDCDVNCSGFVNSADRSIVNAIWRGALGQNEVSQPCPLRD